MTERQVLRGFLANIDVIPPLIVTFQFNPETFSDNKAVNFADRSGDLGGNAPGKEYTGGGDRTISFLIKLHGLEQGTNALNPTPLDNGISTELAKLRSFLYPKSDAWASWGALMGNEEGVRLNAPPTCIFGFGTKILECVVTQMTITEAQFNSMLAPVRADVNITLIVVEKGVLYELDKQRRNALAALGIQNISVF
ncbi:MAG: hypothetical protein IPM76_16500 [Chloroflexi bacterium]|nr:hypothetical protein [Chloroflexota bacterium]